MMPILRAASQSFVRTLLLLAAALVALAVPVVAAAQTVEGTLVEEGRESPIQGALVVLLGGDDQIVGRALTDAAGCFVLRAPAPGEYRVRADRIGFGSTTSAPLQLAAGQTAPLRLVAVGRVVQLQGIRAVARDARRCATRPQAAAGAEVATLWEEARKALALAEFTRQQEGYVFAVRTWRRGLDPASSVVQAESGREAEARSVEPFQSLPAADLAARGYVRADSGGINYYSPDARVLLSDEFLVGHCFRVEEPAQAGSGLVGLAFEPVQGTRLPDVQGVLWLDRATAELHSLRYTYTGLPFPRPQEWGGWVRFQRLESGAWIVRRWNIRMPAFHEDLALGDEDRVQTRESCPWCTYRRLDDPVEQPFQVLAQVVEQGGEVERVTGPDGATVTLARPPSLSGAVWDSTAGRPLAGARVFLAGTGYAAVTDSAGRFTVEGLSEATYAVSFTHPRADTLEFDPAPVAVQVRAGDGNTVGLAIAGISPEQVAAAERAARGPVRQASQDPGRAVALEAVEVNARPQTRLLSNQGFYLRQRRYRGTFMTDEDIKGRLPARAVDLVRGVHGILPRPAGQHLVLTNRRLDRRCIVPVYVDGVHSAHSILDRIRAEDIAAIEVYSHSFVPPQFNPYRDGRACGAVVIWTKTVAR